MRISSRHYLNTASQNAAADAYDVCQDAMDSARRVYWTALAAGAVKADIALACEAAEAAAEADYCAKIGRKLTA
jgi:hypothetical protein